MADIENRLRKLECRNPDQAVEMWVSRGDGFVRHGRPPNEVVLTRDEYDRTYPNSIHWTIKLGDIDEDWRIAAECDDDGPFFPPVQMPD